jgi:predicted DNA-binding transcriptional regulator AlpA
MSENESDTIWDADEVAAYLKAAKASLYRWRMLSYGPPARRIGRHLRYSAREVVGWFDTRRSAP